MKKSLFGLLVISLTLTLAAGSAFAGAFRVPESGARAMGMANAFVGQADDPSAVQFNPAGITQLDGNQILVGGVYVKLANDYTSETNVKSDAEGQNIFLPNFFYTNHLGDSPWWIGFGVNVPFGLQTEWKVDTFDFYVTRTKLEMVKINPSVAYRSSDRFSVAFGIDYYNVSKAIFENSVPVDIGGGPGPYTWANQKLEASGNSYGFDLGMTYIVSDQVQLGFAYRSKTNADLTGDINITSSTYGTLASGTGSTELHLPATAALGVSVKADAKWTLNADLDWTKWSDYDELVIHTSIAPTKVIPKNYDDTITYRFGAQYQLNDVWALRGGVLLENTPIPEDTYDPRVSDGDRVGVSIGAGYTKDTWTFDVAYMFVNLDKYTVNQNVSFDPAVVGLGNPVQTVDGTYEGSINLLGVSVGYKF